MRVCVRSRVRSNSKLISFSNLLKLCCLQGRRGGFRSRSASPQVRYRPQSFRGYTRQARDEGRAADQADNSRSRSRSPLGGLSDESEASDVSRYI